MSAAKDGNKIQSNPGYDINKVDDAVLALLYLTSWQEKGFGDGKLSLAWKGHDWDAMNRLHEKGLIHDPRGKTKSITFTKEGAELSRQLFSKLFGQPA